VCRMYSRYFVFLCLVACASCDENDTFVEDSPDVQQRSAMLEQRANEIRAQMASTMAPLLELIHNNTDIVTHMVFTDELKLTMKNACYKKYAKQLSQLYDCQAQLPCPEQRPCSIENPLWWFAAGCGSISALILGFLLVRGPPVKRD
jgi:hypothetical protein